MGALKLGLIAHHVPWDFGTQDEGFKVQGFRVSGLRFGASRLHGFSVFFCGLHGPLGFYRAFGVCRVFRVLRGFWGLGIGSLREGRGKLREPWGVAGRPY